jgi:glycosyltransferase involved in cell wall biosynthesis
MMSKLEIVAFLHQPPSFSSRSGMYPLVEKLGAHPIFYEERWRAIQTFSWTLGHWLRNFGNWYYGSEWNALIPIWDEWRLRRKAPSQFDIAHYLWGEFASPRRRAAIHRRARAVVGTFHASARRLERVLKGFRSYTAYDWITLMSESQRPYFEAQGFPSERITVILHGVDINFFRPGPRCESRDGEPLRGLLVGSTERDHAFMAKILRALPPGVLEMTILTAFDQRVLNYQGIPSAKFPEFVSEEELRTLYQKADLMIIPMLDCTANNAILESMACGTPVLTNRVGGIPEYVSDTCNYVLKGKDLDEWVALIGKLHRNKADLHAKRPAVRAWAESFDWSRKVIEYLDVYSRCLACT